MHSLRLSLVAVLLVATVALVQAQSEPEPPVQAINLSTRVQIQTGDSVGIAGFIISGSTPKHILVRAIGPSLSNLGVAGLLPDPVLELHGPGPFIAVTNNNWRDDPTQEAAILGTGIAPENDLESAIDITLDPGSYTAVVRGNGDGSGLALVEDYDLSPGLDSKLANLSARAFVSTGDNVVIAGFMLSGEIGDDGITVRGIGPSLSEIGVTNVMADPTLEMRNANGELQAINNDWQDLPGQAAELIAQGLELTNPLESGFATVLPPGAYTVLLAGRNNETGIGLVEVYDLGEPE